MYRDSLESHKPKSHLKVNIKNGSLASLQTGLFNQIYLSELERDQKIIMSTINACLGKLLNIFPVCKKVTMKVGKIVVLVCTWNDFVLDTHFSNYSCSFV